MCLNDEEKELFTRSEILSGIIDDVSSVDQVSDLVESSKISAGRAVIKSLPDNLYNLYKL